MFLAPLSRSRLNEKKTGAGADPKNRGRSHKKKCGSCTGSQKIKSIRKLYCYSSLGKIVSFYDKKTHIILLVLYFL